MERTKLGLGILGAALSLGILGDALLRATPWGINAPIWVAALLSTAILLARSAGLTLGDGEWWLAPLTLLFATFLAWRAAPMLVFLNVSMVLVALSTAAVRGRQGSLRLSGVLKYALGGLYAGLCAAAGPVTAAMRDVEWRQVARGRWQSALAATRGLLIAAPLLLIFGSLFVAADAVFEGLARGVFDFGLDEVFGHLLLAGFVAWVSAGLLRLAFLGREPGWTSPDRPANLSLGSTELGIALGLLNALFFAFVAIQVRYLFGGLEGISISGLTYAEYARRGFFELVVVTALVLPLLLVSHWLFRPESPARGRFFKVLSGTLLALLLVIVASAFYRMWLYLQAFGLTEPRFYTAAFMLWLALLLSWFAATVLPRDRRNHFAFGALLSGFAAVILLNAVNPDAVIARVNIDRLENGERFDPYYLTTLSADAAPVLVAALPEIGGKPLYKDGQTEEVPTIRETVLNCYETGNTDWRTWNFSRWRAGNLIQTATPISGSP